MANPVYQSVLDLYIDDNLVESIVELEGTNWLDHFRLLNLRGNKLIDVSYPSIATCPSLFSNVERTRSDNDKSVSPPA